MPARPRPALRLALLLADDLKCHQLHWGHGVLVYAPKVLLQVALGSEGSVAVRALKWPYARVCALMNP